MRSGWKDGYHVDKIDGSWCASYLNVGVQMLVALSVDITASQLDRLFVKDGVPISVYAQAVLHQQRGGSVG